MFNIQTKIALKNGNPEAYRNAFRVLYPRLKGYCKLFIHAEDQIEDIIQESFITLWDNRKKIKTEKSVEAFLFVITRNKCLNYIKKNVLEKGRIDIDNIPVVELQYLYNLDFLEREQKSLEELLLESLQKAIDDLPEKMKEVFIKCKIEGKKQKEVAEELDISQKMVEKHIFKAKEKITKQLIEKFPALSAVILAVLIR